MPVSVSQRHCWKVAELEGQRWRYDFAKSGNEGLSLSSECSVASRSDLLDIQAAVFVQAQRAGAVVVDLCRDREQGSHDNSCISGSRASTQESSLLHRVGVPNMGADRTRPRTATGQQKLAVQQPAMKRRGAPSKYSTGGPAPYQNGFAQQQEPQQQAHVPRSSRVPVSMACESDL